MITARHIYFAFFCCIFLIYYAAQAQNDHIRFKRLTINDGLSLSSVYTIYQDSKGFMWFGTEDGLNRYDGRNFNIFRPEPANANSLAYKWTELIFEDSHGKLWFGSKGGLTRFDPEVELFTPYGSRHGKNQLLSDTITCMAEDEKGFLWIGTLSGINRINLETGQVDLGGLENNTIYCVSSCSGKIWIGTDRGVFNYSKEGNSFTSISVDHDPISKLVYSIIPDAENNIWFGMGNHLFMISNKEDKPKWVCDIGPKNHQPPMAQIEKLVFDHQHSLWISASDGLYQYEIRNKKLEQVIRSIDSSHSLAINPVKSLHLDQNDNLWYGTFGHGIYNIDINTGRFTNFRNNLADLQSLSENSINCIYEDRTGNIWFGTFGAGINIYNPQAHKFGFLSHQPLNENSLTSNFVWTIMEDRNGLLWIGTNDAGITMYDPVKDTYTNFDHDPRNIHSLSHSSVRKVYQDSKGRIWIGTDGGGLNRFYPKTKRFSHYTNIPGEPTGISSNSVRVIYEDNDGNLWIGTRSGLNLFDPVIETFVRFNHHDHDPTSISNDFIYSAIYQDREGNLWIGTYGGGLNKMDIESDKFICYQNDPDNLESISDNIVFSIYEDVSGTLWIGTNSGLNRFDRTTEKFKRFGIPEGLPNEVIYGVLADNNNHLWLSTNKGICRFDLDSYEVKNFNVNDGLQSNEFNGGAFHRGSSGKLYFGGVYGLNIIDPTLNYTEENKSQVVITRLEVLGREVLIDPDPSNYNQKNGLKNIDDNYFLPRHISYIIDLILNYQHRFFSIEYAALNASNDDNINYQYIMEGLEADWNDAGSRNFITFANLQPGEYTLRVRSVNRDGICCASPAALTIKITPPFWKTWWFYLLEITFILSVIAFIYRFLLKIRTNRLLKIQNEKINLANEKLLASENNLKQLIATKDKFFSIISHDLKNPFTSLLSISELMTKDYNALDEEDKIEGIRGIHDSANRIYRLLENLLTWSRAQSGRIKYEPTNFNLDSVVKDNCLLHAKAAEKKGILFNTEIPDNINVFADKDMISTVIRNLLGNAIKFSPTGKTVNIRVKDDDQFWEINIIDEGVGIADEDLEKIFQIHTKLKTEGTEGEKGTGLGLIISKEFIEKNGGQISVTSEEGKGSTFSFTVLKSKN